MFAAMFTSLGTRLCLHLLAWISLLAVVVALVSQYLFDMAPCAWCVFQRLLYLGIALVCWLGLLSGRLLNCHQRISQTLGQVACAVAALLALGGVLAAWYQHTVAANMFSCAQTFADRFMVSSGLDAHLPALFGIFATCMDARVQVLGVEYAIWSLMLFVLLALLAVKGLFSTHSH